MKLCKDCTEYSCGAQGSDGISQTCGDNGTYFYRTTEKEDHMEKCQEAEGIGCVSCPYGPGNFEEYAIAQKDPTKYCPDAYSDRAQHCEMYNKN